jgi:hypothetical protein
MSSADPMPSPDALDAVDWSGYDFIDLGASSGRSLQACAKRFGARRGLGIDLSARKVEISRTAGHHVVCADATCLGVTDVVRFVSALDFLEHLPDLELVERAIAAAAEAATDFLYISHPSFESEFYLRGLGLIQYWHNWHGHPAHIQISDYCEIFERLGLTQYAIRYYHRVRDASHPSILPLDSPMNSGPYDAAVHGPKPEVTFEAPVWRAQRIFVALRPYEAAEWRAVIGEPSKP